MSNDAEVISAVEFDVTTRDVSPDAAAYARSKMAGLGRITHRPITHGRVRLTHNRPANGESAVIAQANFEISGRPIRAQVMAASARAAVDKLEARMRRRLKEVCARWEPSRGPDAAPPWRHDEKEPATTSMSADGVHIIRRKSYAMAPCTVDEAVAEMELLDYDFHLFNEIGTGAAAVVYRGGPTGLRLDLVTPDIAGQVAHFAQPATISPHPVPCLREHDAVDRLAVLKMPFLFYIDAAAGRASVLYRRIDGDLAVITPAG